MRRWGEASLLAVGGAGWTNRDRRGQGGRKIAALARSRPLREDVHLMAILPEAITGPVSRLGAAAQNALEAALFALPRSIVSGSAGARRRLSLQATVSCSA